MDTFPPYQLRNHDILVTDFSYAVIPMIGELIEIGSEVRNIGQEGLTFTIFDKKVSISGINWEITRLSLDQSIAALWTDDPIYGHYLTSTFEILWQQSVPASEKIQELLAQGPPQA